MKKLLFILGVFIALLAVLAVTVGTGFIRSTGCLVCGIYMGLGIRHLEEMLNVRW